MKNVFNKVFAASTLSLLVSANSFAADGTINFVGKVVEPACTVADGKDNINVTLPTVHTSALGAKGDKAGQTLFTISLTGCKGVTVDEETTYPTVRVAFAGQSDPAILGALKNTATDGAATGVGLVILQEDETQVNINNHVDNETNPDSYRTLSSADADLNYVVAYVNTEGTVTSGNVVATATYSIEYK